MPFYKFPLVGISVVVMVLAGCSSDRFPNASTTAIPCPVAIHIAQHEQHSQSSLPSLVEDMDSDIPEINQKKQKQHIDDFDAASAGIELSPSNIAGVWKALVAGMSCQIATPQTKFGKGYRAGPLRCPAAFSGISSWTVNGSRLVFYDKIGNTIATLYSSDGANFEGWTTSGARVVLNR